MFHTDWLHEVAISRTSFFAALVVAAICLAVPAAAQVNAPTWWGTQDDYTVSLGFQFPDNAWQPPATYSVGPAWYGGTTWDKQGPKTPQWAPQLSGHDGVWGLTDGYTGDGTLSVKVGNQYREAYVKQVWYKFDIYQVD